MSNISVTRNLIKSLTKSVVEKDVENAWRNAFEKKFPGYISSPDKSDGVLRNCVVTSLLEFKFDIDLRNQIAQAGVLVQSIYYLKKMEQRGEPLTKAVFIGDRNECFCVPTASLTKYLSYDIDWSIPPSSAAKKNPSLVAEIAQDEEIEPFVYDINENFDFLLVLEKLKNISLDKPFAITITAKNIVEIFKRFETDIVKDKYYTEEQVFDEDEGKRMSELVDLFFTCLTAPNEAYLHPKRSGIVVARGKHVKVNSKNYRIFFSQFKQDYKPSELEAITANKDRILEDTHRRHTGAFFTPDIWVAEAHKMIAEQFGDDWKEEYVVWDCAAGTANLTRGYKFKELYVSTLEQSDINTIKDCGYNPEATVFQYNFLDEVGIDSCPNGLKKAFEEGKKVLFLINPPYGRSGNFDLAGGKNKKGIADTAIGANMKKESYGGASSQLYTQFLYKIYELNELKNVNICLYAKSLYKTGSSFKKFREKFYTKFQYANGFLFNASHFDGVSFAWGIDCSIWISGKEERQSLPIKISEIGDDFKPTITRDKDIYNLDKLIPMSKWLSYKYDMVDFPKMSSYTQCKDTKWGYGIDASSVSTLVSHSNNVYENAQSVYILNGGITRNVGKEFVNSKTFLKCVSIFAARKSVKGNWINDKDEYLVPDTEHPDYEQWNNDAIVYSLFNNSSQQSSLRNVMYKDKKWDIVNNFFFMSNDEMKELADNNGHNLMYQDTKTFGDDRYVYSLLEETTLSEDAQDVLDTARELVRKTFNMRKVYSENNPKYHLNSWDAGYAQIKNLWKEYFPEDLKVFRDKYKEFENRMRIGVYKFKFLKK